MLILAPSALTVFSPDGHVSLSPPLEISKANISHFTALPSACLASAGETPAQRRNEDHD
jgi:hypothetical protein